ncbi:hypothetical protein HFU84_05540, partial [Acidithiobacillus sp. CV18-2]|nr:hypothetical protein [Acidithiobacillus sp. CV18-2]
MDSAERSDLRRILFRLLLGDFMAQLDGYATSARETDAERTAIFDVLLETLTDHQAMEDLSGSRLLGGICSG